ncbi:hypothetical protein OSTOST_10230, partial [Ostertagia ostertagi]
MDQYITVLRTSTKKRKSTGNFEMLSVEVEVTELAGMNTIVLRIEPLDSAEYAILVDFVLTIGEETIERDLWEPGKKVLEKHTASSGPLNLMVCTVQLLSPVDLSRQTAYRNFEVRCGPYNFFVDLRILAELGGPLFSSWKVK